MIIDIIYELIIDEYIFSDEIEEGNLDNYNIGSDTISFESINLTQILQREVRIVLEKIDIGKFWHLHHFHII